MHSLELYVSWLWVQAIFQYGSCVRGNRMGAPLLEALMFTKGRLWVETSLYASQFGNLEWDHLQGTLRYG
jgi:hypothetical protein